MAKALLLLLTLVIALGSCTSPSSAPSRPAVPASAVASPSPSTGAKKLEISEENAGLIQHLENYPDLEVLSISCLEDLRALPDSIGKLAKLKELRIDNGNGCSMNPVLPEAIGNLQSLEKLVLFGAQDPGEAGRRPAEHHKFPKSMSQLKNLTYLDLGRNGFERVPLFVRDLPKLATLNLDFNRLDDLPDFLSTMPNLNYVKLGDNHAITDSAAKKKDLRRRFPKIEFDFNNEFD